MNILNKKTIIVAAASLLWMAGIQIGFAKPPAGGGAASHIQKGIELAQQKQYDGAIAEFTKAVEANPKDPRGYTNRGTAYRAAARAAEAAGDTAAATTRYSAALADFSKLIDLAPKDASAYLERGQTEYIMRQYDPAVADLNKALELKPNDPLALKFRGAVEIGLSQWDKAVADLSAAIQAQRSNQL